jgi:8-oxo-dGTP diphosphatase
MTLTYKTNEIKYVIPQNRNSYTPDVSRRWTNMNNPRKRTLIVTINGEEHVYPPKAGVIIFNKDLNKVLIVKSRGYYNSGTRWGLPKGHLENNELPNECATRELYEETGIKIHIPQKSNNYINSINNSIYYIYIVDEKKITLKPIDTVEIINAKFCYINRLKTIKANILYKELQKVVGKYLKNIKKLAKRIKS